MRYINSTPQIRSDSCWAVIKKEKDKRKAMKKNGFLNPDNEEWSSRGLANLLSSSAQCKNMQWKESLPHFTGRLFDIYRTVSERRLHPPTLAVMSIKISRSLGYYYTSSTNSIEEAPIVSEMRNLFFLSTSP